MSVCSLLDLLLLYFDKRDGFANRNHKFYSSTIKIVLATINGMSHHLFVAGIWIGTGSGTGYTLHGSATVVEKSNILLQIFKAAERNYGDFTCYVFILQDVVAHVAISDLSGSNINFKPRKKSKTR